jgi:hypothetical protein
MIMCFARNSLKAIAKPNGTPMRVAKKVDAQLTFNETPTMEIISASSETTRRIADTKLSMSKSTVTKF